MKVSIIIKALDEEANIARTIESCLAALQLVQGEIILADSLSSDRTIEIASAYPIKIVQLISAKDRGCGTAPQLGYQYATGDFIYLIDGDMALHLDFLPAALLTLSQDEKLAGVGGLVRDMNLSNLEFKSRALRTKKDLQPGEVDRLEGGGLYRRAAIESVSYFSDRNLHAFEELELATRLRAKGWRFVRINQIAVDHYGYEIGAYRLLWNRLKSGYALGAGEIARATFGCESFPEVFQKVRLLWISMLVIAWLLAVPISFYVGHRFSQGVAIAALVFLIPFMVMILKRRSFQLGVYAVVSWIVFTFGTLSGLFRKRVDPLSWIPSRIVLDPAPASAVQTRAKERHAR